ncbi:hypothetical protein Sjap_024278 [Stephania japonica]|uniref:SURP motif domain-containing protein n=1 Tax=Stephania japonica TaxID=461633 RepID=A0AAP0ED33_9MAGN
MDSDEEDFVFFGTPIEREEESTLSRKKKSAAEAAGQLRNLPAWKQEVRDEEGRRRFHGAFTGGFSAGYYNTVGSKEGWTPQSFTSSRKKRAEVTEQNMFSFLDDEEKAEMESQSLATSLQFDTFGFTAAEIARKQAEKEQKKRSSAIPGPVPDEILIPAANSIGVKLLLKMGWRHGRSIKDSRASSLYETRREARKALLAFSYDESKPVTELDPEDNEDEAVKRFEYNQIRGGQSTPVFVLNPKQDMHGLGFDPFKHAPEFRERKRLRLSGNQEHGRTKSASVKGSLFSSKSGKVAPGFGIGALEELDMEDEDIYTSAIELDEPYIEEVEEPSISSRDDKQLLIKDAHGTLPGFRVASNSDLQFERHVKKKNFFNQFNPPIVPTDFEPHHKFFASLETEKKLACPPPPEVLPPEDNNLRVMIDGFATLVARSGKLFENLSREKNKKNPLFSFLSGGNGHDYYERRLWEEQQKHGDEIKQPLNLKSMQSVDRMTAESRGKILGERPLERSSKDSSAPVASTDAIQLQFNLSDTFTKPTSMNEFVEAAKPFIDNPAKQDRFERFLKEKNQGGLRSTSSAGSSNLSEADRARERLDFEAAAEAIEKGKWAQSSKRPSEPQFKDILAANSKFTSGGQEQLMQQAKISQLEEQIINRMYPKREEFQWRPSPILCKRFDITDPYMGKPPPLPRAKGRIDSLMFTPDFVKTTKSEETFAATRDSLLLSQSEPQDTREQITSTDTVIESNNTNVERPVDLYKAIFSDDSDEEEPDAVADQERDLKTKSEGTASTALNRLIAGDFLESLGKELGLALPPEPPMDIVTGVTASRKETVNTSTREIRISSGNAYTSSGKVVNECLIDQHADHVYLNHSESVQEASQRTVPPLGVDGNVRVENYPIEAKTQKISSNVDKNKTRSRQKRSSSESSDGEKREKYSRRDRKHRSSEDERNSSHPRRNRYKSASPEANFSEDDRYQEHSKKESSKKGSSRGKSGDRKQSKRHKGRPSDTESSEDDGYRERRRGESSKKGSSKGKSSDRKRSKHHSRRREDSPSTFSRDREHAEDKEERRKSREERKSSSKSDSRWKQRTMKGTMPKGLRNWSLLLCMLGVSLLMMLEG